MVNAYAHLPIPAGETVRWTGVPSAGIAFRPSDVFAIPFSVMWAGFAFFWEWNTVTRGAPGFFALWGIPFVLVGLYVSIGRFFYDAYRRSRTRYAVTDVAAYVQTGGIGGGLRRFSGSALDNIAVRRSADGSGTIDFASPATAGYRNGFAMWQASPNAFTRIRDLEAAYAAILAIRKA